MEKGIYFINWCMMLMNKIVDDNFLKNDLGLIGVDYYIMRNYLGLVEGGSR